MRDTYGKLMYILMDTESYQVKSELKLDFVKDIVTVYTFLDDKGLTEILRDPLWQEATQAIHDNYGEISKRELQILNTRKQQAIETLVKKYTNGKFVTLSLSLSLSLPLYCMIG